MTVILGDDDRPAIRIHTAAEIGAWLVRELGAGRVRNYDAIGAPAFLIDDSGRHYVLAVVHAPALGSVGDKLRHLNQHGIRAKAVRNISEAALALSDFGVERREYAA